MKFLSHYLKHDLGGGQSEDWARNSKHSGSCPRADLRSRLVADDDTAGSLYLTLTLAELRMVDISLQSLERGFSSHSGKW